MRASDLLISPDWWVSVLSAAYAHLAKLCLLPACSSAISETEPTVPSIIFVVAVTLAVVEHDLWPPSLRCPPALLLLLYEALVAVILTNAAYLMIWIPIVSCCALICSYTAYTINGICTSLGLDFGKNFAAWLETEVALDIFLNIVAVFILMWMIVATDIASNFIDWWSSGGHKESACSYDSVDTDSRTIEHSPYITPDGRRIEQEPLEPTTIDELQHHLHT